LAIPASVMGIGVALELFLNVYGHYGYFIWLSPIGMWIHGGLLGNKSRYAKLISQGFECVDDFEANNSPHAIALFEKSKQAS